MGNKRWEGGSGGFFQKVGGTGWGVGISGRDGGVRVDLVDHENI